VQEDAADVVRAIKIGENNCIVDQTWRWRLKPPAANCPRRRRSDSSPYKLPPAAAADGDKKTSFVPVKKRSIFFHHFYL
jgi:hypothetical protein